MYRPRLIPVLLIDGGHACKTIQFKKRINLGDPVNAVSIFNTFQVDEIIVLNIPANSTHRTIDFGILRDIASEAKMPLSMGGGVRTLDQVSKLLSMGAEKVILSTALYENPSFVAQAVRTFGSSSIAVCIDIGTDWLRRPAVYYNSGKRKVSSNPLEVAKRAEELGAGEIVLQSISHDGMMNGYNITQLSELSSSLRVPVVALGGAGSLQHLIDAYVSTEVSALASGSFFFFKGLERGVLISYPDSIDLHKFKNLRKK
jgi:cyclase